MIVPARVHNQRRTRLGITSSIVAVVLLVAANLVPVVGVLFFGWKVLALQLTGWVEFGVAGLFTLLKMMVASGEPPPEPPDPDAGPNDPEPIGFFRAKWVLVFLFPIGYVGFWLLYRELILALPGFAHFGAAPLDFGPLPAAGALWGLALGFAASHGASFYFNFIRGGESERNSAWSVFETGIDRLRFVQFSLFVGSYVVVFTGSSVALMVALVGLKIAVDLAGHINEHLPT